MADTAGPVLQPLTMLLRNGPQQAGATPLLPSRLAAAKPDATPRGRKPQEPGLAPPSIKIDPADKYTRVTQCLGIPALTLMEAIKRIATRLAKQTKDSAPGLLLDPSSSQYLAFVPLHRTVATSRCRGAKTLPTTKIKLYRKTDGITYLQTESRVAYGVTTTAVTAMSVAPTQASSPATISTNIGKPSRQLPTLLKQALRKAIVTAEILQPAVQSSTSTASVDDDFATAVDVVLHAAALLDATTAAKPGPTKRRSLPAVHSSDDDNDDADDGDDHDGDGDVRGADASVQHPIHHTQKRRR